MAHAAARLVRAAMVAWTRRWTFLVVFALVLAGSVSTLASLNLLPDPVTSNSSSALIATTTQGAVSANLPELPVKLAIPTISLSVLVSNPRATDTELLDKALLSGAVRYPTSGELGQDNVNVVIFGHSSYLPVVGNQAYKTFDGIQKLHTGDPIIVYSSGTAYTYSVKSVAKESANDAGVPLIVSGRELTLSTCDSFAAKTDRFVVVADFVGSRPIPG